MNKRIFLFLSSWLFVLTVFTQNIDAVILPPPQTAYIADFFSNPNLFRVIVTNKTLQAIDVKIGGKLILDGTVLGATDVKASDVFTLNPGVNFLNGEDVFKEFMRGNVIADTSNQSLQNAFYSGQWPSGLYEWCIEINHATTNAVLLPNKCVPRFVTSYQPPILILPNEGQVLNNPGTVLFRWTPITPAYREGIVYYEVRVFDIKTGQTPMQAFQANLPIIEKKVPSQTVLIWPSEVPVESGQYIWTVRALDAQDRPISFPTQYAEPLTFTINKGIGANGGTGQLAFSAVYPKTESSISTTELDGKFMRFQVDLSALGAASTEANNGLRIYMIEKKAGFYTKAALLQAIQRDKLHYKSPLLNINAQINNLELSKILPDSLAGREFAWMIRAEVAGRTYDSDLFTFEYKSPTSKPINKPKPKFDCECKDTLCAPPVIADRSGVSTWKVGDTLLLGRYELRLTEWSNGDGKGIIDLPYGKVGVKVGLSGIRANKAKQIFEGTATMEDSDFPNDIKDFGTFKLDAETLASLNAHFARMSGALEEGLKMPFSFKEHLSVLQLKLPFDLVVTGMRFSPEESSLDLAVLIEHTPGQFVKFMAKNVPMAANGISFKDLKLYLAEDVVVNNLSLKTSADVTKGSYIQFDCDGIKTFHLNTGFTFDPQHVQTLSDQPLTTVVKFDAEKWGDFLATASLEAFRLTDAKGITFDAKDWTFDKSTARNPEGLKLPNQATTPMAWQGFFTEGGTVKVSKDLLPAAEKDLELTGKNIAWDSLGLSGQMIATEFSLAAQGSDWNVGIDSFKVQIDKSKLKEMSFVGDLSLSYLFKDLKYKALFKRDAQDRIVYQFSPAADAEAKLWKTKFKLANTSSIVLMPTQGEGDETNWNLAANLDADISFDIANTDIDTGYVSVLKNLLGFSDFSFDIPTLTVKGFKINHPDLPEGQKIGVQDIKADRPFKLGGLDIDLLGVDFEADTMMVNGEAQKAQVMVLHLSKEVDFDCKIWAVQSATDTSRWDFGKLSFGLPTPKIECKVPDTLVLDKETNKPIGLGDKIKVGSFTMQVEKLASQNTSGKGIIRIPYLATNIAVEFNSQLKINDSGVAFEGAALADFDAAILPTESFFNGIRKINFNLLNKNKLAGHLANLNRTANILPLSFKKTMRSYGSKLPFDVLVTDLRFMSTQPSLSLAMIVPMGEQAIHFELPQLAFNERGFNLADIKMQLVSNIDLGSGIRLLRGSDSYAQLNCNGFETFGLAGDYALSPNQFAAIGKSTPALATFKVKTKQFSDFIATAEIEPFSVKAIAGSEISVTNSLFDRSTTENVAGLEFPKKYKGNTAADWKGFYVQDFTMKMPSILPNQEDKTLTFTGKNLILDSTGVTTTIKTSNITSMGSTAFGLNIKDLTVDIVQNTLDNALLSGNVQLPLFSEAIEFEGTYAKDSTGTTTYALKTSNEANLNFWRANLKINKGSGLELVKNSSDKWEQRASIDLEAKLDVNTQMLEEYVSADILRGLKTALGVDLLDFEIPTFKFKGLKINHPEARGGRQYALDAYETTGPIKIAGQEVKLTDLDIVEDTVTVKGKSYKKGVGLVFSFFKGTDFELSTWAVPSEADTNKWTFGKWDLKFAIPKFECAEVPTENVAASGGQALTIGQAVNVGGFVMKVEQLASGAQKGIGKLRIPYFGSTLKVNFDAATQANAAGQLLNGVLLSQVDNAIIPIDALVGDAEGLRKVAIDKLNVNGLKNVVANAAETGIQLPLSLKQSMGRFGSKLPFDIWLTHINFRGSESYMSLAMLLPYGGTNVARFSVPKVRLNSKGFNLSNLEIGLAQDLELASGLYLRGSEGADKTMGILDCDGFKGLKLDGFYNLDNNLFANVLNTNPPQINFKGEAKSLSDFILDAKVEPLSIKAFERSELSVSKAVIDRSDTKNPGAMKFPTTYKGKTGANWTGVYVQDFTLKLPSMLPSQEDKILTFNGQSLILDSTGITALANATNITDIGASGFGLTVDTVSVSIVQNNLNETRLAGRINLPLFGEGIRYAGTYAKDSTGTTTFALKTTQETNLNFWKANVKIQPNSGLELVKNSNNKWERRASIDLEAKLDVNTQMLEEYVSADILRGLKTALGVDLLDFEIPTFKFKGLKINHPKAKGGRYYSLDGFESTGKIKIAGQEVTLNDVDVVEDTLSVKGKSYKKGVGLVFSFFKGTDFELSTWAVPTEADTNKWTFGKWDLKFAIPKFECAPVAPVTVNNSGSQPLELNKTVQIGSFSMTIDQAANGTQLGVGRIRVPYFGSTLKVNFDEKLRVNAQNQAFGGVVWSLVNPAILPTTSLLTEATTGLRNVKIAGLDVNALSQIASGNSPIGIPLPLSLKQSMGKFGKDLPFDVLVTHINFLGTAPYMSLAMLVPTPSGDLARFEVPKLPLSNKGFDMSNLQVRLADEMALGKGFYLSGAETTTPTFATLNCGGLSGFQLNGYYELDRDLFSSINGTGAPKARFTAKAEGLGQFIATAAVEPLRINALNGSELTITNAILDRSNTENSSSAKFPKAYKGNKDASWQGLFVGDFTLKVPSFLPNQADKKLNLSGKNMVFDSTGATALIEATNVLAASSNTEGGWGLSVDTLNMTMVASKVDSAYVSGKIELPFFSQNIPYNGVFQYNKTSPYYNLSTSADATIDFWRTSIGVTKGSNVEVYKNAENKWERRAKLNLEAKIDVNTQALSEYVDASVLNAIKDALGVNLLDFELPKIKFNGFKINYPNLPAGKTFALDSISYTGSLRLGGQEIKLTTVELVQDSVTIKGKSFSKGVGLVFKLFKGVDFDFSIWSVPSSTDSTKWTFGKYDLNFGLPKFECVEPKPFVVEKSSPRIPKVGEMVNLAGFSMKIDQLASAAQMGIGRIRIPYLGTTIKVNFGETLSLNAEGKVNAGVAFSQINNALFPNNAITTVNNMRRVAISQLNENALDQIIANNTPDGIKLPLSLRKSMGGFGSKLPFDVLITNINFEGISPNMSLAALVPDRSGKLVKFSVPSLGINSKGFNFSDVRFQLGENYELSKGLFLNGSETERKTSVNFNCDGFVSMNLDGYYQLNPQQFTLIGKTDAPKLTFKATATSMSNFIAQATAEPMQIVGLDKSELRLTKLVYDRSTTENEPTMRFPERYKGKTDATWNGIYVQEATLKLPSFLPNDNQTLTFSGKNIIIDSTGATGTLDAANVLKATASGWGLQVDTVRLTVLQNKLDSAALMGALNIPLFAESVKYMGRYKQDSANTNLRVGTTEDASLKFFGASITLLKGAEVELDKTPTQWERRAKMDVDAEFKINRDSLTKYGGVVASLDKLMKDMGLPNLDFEFPKIKLRGLKVNHKSLPMGKNYGVEGIDKSGDLKIAGQTVAIRSIDLVESAKSMVIKGKTYAKSLGLVFQLNKVVDAELAIYMVPDPKDATKWTFGKFELSNAIPKFECVAVTPATAPTGSVKALAVNQEVTVGDFKMKVTKLPAGTATGEGEVRIPYMGTTVKVKFDNGFKVNTEGKAFGGIVASDLNTTGFFPTGSFTNNATVGNIIDVAKMKLDNLTSLVSTDIPIQMPMSLQQRLGRLGNQLPFDLLVTNINLASAKQSMSLAMLVPNVMGTTVRFATDDLMLNGKGFGLSSLQLGLAGDINLGSGVFLNGGATGLRTKAVFNCDGMESFSLAGRYEFPNTTFVKPLSGTGNAKLEFSGTSSNLTNFIVEATASPMQLSLIDGSELRLTRLSYDRSATANAAGIKFPPQYGATVPTSWRGFYAAEASLAIPSLLPNQSGKLRFAGKNILLDSLGLSGEFQVQDLFSTKVDNLWSLKFDTLGVNVVRGKLGDIQVAGEIGFPVLGVSSRFDGKGVQTILGKDTTYKYTLAPRGDLSMDAWRVKFNLLKSSKIDLVREQKAGKVTNTIDAQLDAELSVDLNTDFIKNNADPALVDLLRNKLGINVLDFSFPKFKLEGFKISPLASQKVSFGKITPIGDLTLAGVKIDLVSTTIETAEIVTKAGRKAATGFVMTMRKSGVNFKFRVWAVPSSADTTKWDFGKLDLVLDLPKFSCTAPTITTLDKSAGSLAANKKVKVVGGFTMEITQLASGATAGRGKITVPHFGTTYDVAFGTDLKINAKDEVFEGVISTLPNQDIFPADAIVKRTTGVLDLDLQKLQITEALTSKLQSLNSVTKFPISMSSALLKMSEMLDVPALDIPLDITLTGIYFTPQGAMLGGFTAVGTDGKYLRMGVGGLTIHQNGITFDKLKLFLVDNL